MEFQHTIKQLLLKRTVSYCLQAIKKYKVSPVILIACVDTLHTDAAQHTTASRFSGGYAFPSYPGAADCTSILKKKKKSLDGDFDIPQNPFIALGLFFTYITLSITNCPLADD